MLKYLKTQTLKHFMICRKKKKNPKKDWYKRNSEKVKTNQANYYANNTDDINTKLRGSYDPMKRKKAYNPKKQKDKYDSEKRKAAYLKEKNDEIEGIFKERRVLRRDRKYHEYCNPHPESNLV